MNSKIITLTALLLTFFVLVFGTRPLFYALQENLDIQATAKLEQEDKKEQLKKIQQIQEDVKTGTGEMIDQIKMYAQEFSEDRVIDYIYNYIQDTNGLVLVRELNMDTGDVNEFGFNEGKVQVELRVNDEAVLLDFIEAMTNPVVTSGENVEVFKFFIDTFSYPTDVGGNFNVSVPMKIFYK